MHQCTGSQAGERQRVKGWCAAQPWESAPSAEVTSWLTPVLPDASPWSCELAMQASAGELQLLPPSAFGKQKGHFNKVVGGVTGGRGTEISLGWGNRASWSDSVSPCTWVQKESGLTLLSCFCSRAS